MLVKKLLPQPVAKVRCDNDVECLLSFCTFLAFFQYFFRLYHFGLDVFGGYSKNIKKHKNIIWSSRFRRFCGCLL